MPDVEANRRQWDGDYAWPEAGEEWSTGWGGADAQWHFTLEPRLRSFLPASTILEIAPGYGRWTRYLAARCERYVGVDLSAQCVEACQTRFAGAEHAEFHVGDGRSLTAVNDSSVDFAFSFDSLVHVEDDVIASYLTELQRVLTDDGVAFLHHSNLAACRPVARPIGLALRRAERIRARETRGFDQWRGATMSAERLEQLAAATGLVCIGQEVVNWLSGRLIDCMSLVTPKGSKRERPNVVMHNPYFMAEAASTARAAQVYSEEPPASMPPLDGGSRQHLGSLASTAYGSIGPWGFSVVGPLPKTRLR